MNPCASVHTYPSTGSHPQSPAPLSGDPPAAKLNYTDECDAPIVAGGGGVLGAGRRAKHGSNVSLIAY